jgi:RNA polymerase sigma-70 factor (ECF subfamily)
VGRFKAIDTIRRRTRFDTHLAELAQQLDTSDTTIKDHW